MLFDPDAGLSLKEVLQRKWETEWDARFKTHLLAFAETQGCTWMEAMVRLMLRFREQYADPTQRPYMDAWHAQQRCPFGKDPLLNTRQP